MPSSADWINILQLVRHPEGGYYREIYRSEGIIAQPTLPMRYSGGRAFATTIYYLLESGDVSHLHRLKSDEQWFHIDGTALTIHSIDPDGTYSQFHIGKDLHNGERPHAVVPRGCWFGGTVDTSGSFTLVGCFVAPGFDFDDFELAKRESILKQFPQHNTIITRLTKK
jgi:predicted cupin superfamily sugar epimerase